MVYIEKILDFTKKVLMKMMKILILVKIKILMKIMMLKLSSLYKKDNDDDKDNDGEVGSNDSGNIYYQYQYLIYNI